MTKTALEHAATIHAAAFTASIRLGAATWAADGEFKRQMARAYGPDKQEIVRAAREAEKAANEAATAECEAKIRSVILEAADALRTGIKAGVKVLALVAPGLLSDDESEEHDFPAGSIGKVEAVIEGEYHVSFPFPHKHGSMGVAVLGLHDIKRA